MLGLDELETGLMIWATPDPLEAIRAAKAFGLRCGQVGFPGALPLDGAAERWDAALNQEHFTAVTAFCAFSGEDYADIPTVTRTVGLTPPETRRERLLRTAALSRLARELGIDSLACHIGVIAPDHGHPLYREICETTREICDICQANGQRFTLETGQEPAKVLLRFMEDVDRPNLAINFDPANMILYGTGDPVDALEALGKHVISVHCKDGDWPPREHPEALGEELPLGKGKVDFPAFIAKLKSIGYTGPLIIEREAAASAQRDAEIRDAIQLLGRLKGLSKSRSFGDIAS